VHVHNIVGQAKVVKMISCPRKETDRTNVVDFTKIMVKCHSEASSPVVLRRPLPQKDMLAAFEAQTGAEALVVRVLQRLGASGGPRFCA
jgi:hypothetical protein